NLLCLDRSTGTAACSARPDDALAVLHKVQNPDVSVQLLRGRAQLAASRYANAAQTLDKIANNPSATSAQQLEALELAGDAFVGARSYDEGAGRYGKWLGLASSGSVSGQQASGVALKRARAFRVRHAFDEAVDALFQALMLWPDATAV